MKCVAIISCSESSLFGDGVTLRNGVSVHFSARLIEIVDNVFLGDMSQVGLRPEVRHYVDY